MRRHAVLVAALALAFGCSARTPPRTAAAPGEAPVTGGAHENLNATLWMQTAIEYEATAIQAYRLAQLQLDAALADRTWTAAIEQTRDASRLPPAVVVDVDETVLDNSYYQARMIRDNTLYSSKTWDPWVMEARATAIPGAREFAQYAVSKGVTLFYVTNRTANLEEATRANLEAEGFPVASGVDVVLTRGERPEWNASPKGPRRAHIAERYRILLLIGDDLGDFVVDAAGTAEARQGATEPHADWWGRRWIMLPNPTYGSWERAIIGEAADPNEARRRALRYVSSDR